MVLVLHHPVSLVQMAESQSKAVIHQERDWKRTVSLKAIKLHSVKTALCLRTVKAGLMYNEGGPVTLVILTSSFYV